MISKGVFNFGSCNNSLADVPLLNKSNSWSAVAYQLADFYKTGTWAIKGLKVLTQNTDASKRWGDNQKVEIKRSVKLIRILVTVYVTLNSFITDWFLWKNMEYLSNQRIIFSKDQMKTVNYSLTLSWRRSLLYRNQSTDLQSKSMDRFLYDRNFRHERV